MFRPPVLILLFSLVLTSFLLFSCSHQQTSDFAIEDLSQSKFFIHVPQIIKPEEIFSLMPAQQAHFLDFYNSEQVADRAPNMRIFEYLERSTYDFHYKARTHIASETLEITSGNCLSLAIVTTALAQLVGVPVRYQLVDSTPVFERKGDTILRSVHIRSRLGIPDKESETNVGGSGIIIDYFPGDETRFLGNINHNTFASMYYNNLASEFLADGNLEAAYWYARQAIIIAPYYAANINTLAVIFRRTNEIHAAENLYLYGLELTSDKLVILQNYRQLLLTQNRLEEATKLSKRIDLYENPSPYPWLILADDAYKNQHFDEAKKYYLKAVSLAPYLQYGYLGLAKVAFAQGDLTSAIDMLNEARQRNSNSITDSVYNAKLATLKEKATLKLDFYDTK